MKKSLLLITMVFGSMQSADWRRPGPDRIDFQDTVDLIDHILMQVGCQDSPCVHSFKEKAGRLHDQLDFQIAQYQSTHRSSDLNKAKVTLQALQAEEEQLLTEMQKTLDPIAYQRLRAELHVLQYDATRLLDIFGIKERLGKLLAKYSSQFIKNQVNSGNKYKDEIAYARQDSALCEFEQQFRQKRQPVIKRGQATFFGRQLPDTNKCTLGFVGTGGGYRAMILTTGYARALEKMGLLDASMYMTSLSGSTWFLVPWTISQKSVAEYKDILLEKVRNDNFNIAELSAILCSNPLRFINDIVWPKFVFGQAIDSVDLYGALLAMILFSDLESDRHSQHLSDQLELVKDASQPFPIYTSVSMTRNKKDNKEYGYNWYEFNPAEVRNLDYDAYIPSWAFDCPFEGGHSLEIAPEQSMGYLMGIFGSAYTVNFTDLNRIMFSSVDTAPSWADPMERIKFKVAKRIVALMSNVPLIGKKRFSPAEVNNPFTHADLDVPSWLKKRDEIVMVDAGISYNIPARPLFRPERGVNAIIVGDSSGGIFKGKELRKLFADIHRVFGYEYTRVDDQAYQSLQLYKDLDHDQAPCIIYVNYINEQKLRDEVAVNPELHQFIQDNNIDQFDAKQCLDEHCSTFNFDYDEEQFLQLSGIAEFNMLAHQDRIRAFIELECLSA